MDENPYQAPIEVGATHEVFPAPGRLRKGVMAAACIASGALFASLIIYASWRDGGWTLRSLVPMGVALLVNGGCLAMGRGLLSEKRLLAVVGASVVIAILAVMFTGALLHAR